MVPSERSSLDLSEYMLFQIEKIYFLQTGTTSEGKTCPGEECPGGNCPGGKCPRTIILHDDILESRITQLFFHSEIFNITKLGLGGCLIKLSLLV